MDLDDGPIEPVFESQVPIKPQSGFNWFSTTLDEDDENNNPNNATTVSAKSEALLRPGPDVVQLSRGILNKDIIQHQSAQDPYVQFSMNDADSTSMSHILQKYQQKRESSNGSR